LHEWLVPQSYSARVTIARLARPLGLGGRGIGIALSLSGYNTRVSLCTSPPPFRFYSLLFSFPLLSLLLQGT